MLDFTALFSDIVNAIIIVVNFFVGDFIIGNLLRSLLYPLIG
jgi:hypothetical protein